MGLAPADLAMAILIQAWVPFDAGGTAEAHDDGSVLVTAVDGSPDVLVAGRADGVVALVGLDGAISRRDAGADVGSATFRAVADLARRTMQATGDRAIEWGTSAGRLALLQVRRAPAAADAGASTPLPPRRSLPPSAERLALLAMRFPGPLGERLVLPWAFALREPPPPYSVEVLDPVTAIAEVIAVARALTAEAWGRTPAVAEREAAETMRLVLGPEPERGIERLSRLRPVDPAAAARVPAMVSAIGRALTSTGALGRPEMVWRLSTDELVSAAAGAAVPARLGPDRWEPFLFAVAATNGLVVQGTGASPGIGAGRLRILRGPAASWRPEPREILAIPAPVPQVSPLLWNAAGLVALGGNVGAHVFEVARSLGVPAVVGVDVPQAHAGALAAVDGASGRLSVLGLPNESLGTKGA
jgi:phosphohistidine swiveling domain-containing protein